MTHRIYIEKEQEAALLAMMLEMHKQDDRWGKNRALAPRTWLAVLMLEVGEVAKADLEHDYESYCHELAHVAAVAIQALIIAKNQPESFIYIAEPQVNKDD